MLTLYPASRRAFVVVGVTVLSLASHVGPLDGGAYERSDAPELWSRRGGEGLWPCLRGVQVEKGDLTAAVRVEERCACFCSSAIVRYRRVCCESKFENF